MILSMSGQAWLFLGTVVAGFVIGFVYDIFRIARKTAKHKSWLVQFEDVLYWSVASVMMFLFMLHQNNGEVRLFAIAGAAIGMVLYFNSLSPLIIKVSVAVIDFFKKVILTIVRIILVPVKILISLLKILAKPCVWLIKSFCKRANVVKLSSRNKLLDLRRKVVLKNGKKRKKKSKPKKSGKKSGTKKI